MRPYRRAPRLPYAMLRARTRAARTAALRACAAAALVALGASSALAESDPDSLADLSLEELLEIETASFVMPTPARQPVSLTTISRAQIARSGARTLNELLMLHVPGYFLVEDQDDVIAAFRGLAPDNNSKVLLLLDGRNLNTEWFMGPADAILNGLDLGFVERVEIIRGPGSVTLGQGALLGVINIITRRGESSGGFVSASGGLDGYAAVRGHGAHVGERTSAHLYLSHSEYRGQPLRPEGWAITQENPSAVRVIDRGHRLKAADQTLAMVRLEHGGLTVQAMHVDQVRDTYNFYRDREEHHHRLMSLAASYQHELGAQLRVRLEGGLDRDEFGYLSHAGLTMSGTREDRLSTRALLNADELVAGNRLAVGVELRRFEMGKRDRFGQNLIVNQATDRPLATNARNTYVERTDINAFGVFVEDVQDIAAQVSLFAGLRLDIHPFWGAHLSPRAGAIASPLPQLTLRASYQAGFRGAVGVHYTGGWRRDGLLHEASFDRVEDNPLVAAAGFGNLDPVAPERVDSLELGARYQPFEALTIEGVAFFNRLTNVIDVGVLFMGDDPAFVAAPEEQRTIGTDIVGDWNGWFYFRNNDGTITSAGGEAGIHWRGALFEAHLTHSLARILSAPAELATTMYISGPAGEPHFRAYPENVTRLHVAATPYRGLVAAAELLRYSAWYSPDWSSGGADGDSGVFGNLQLAYSFEVGVRIAATIKNVTDAHPLWPMNSIASDPSRSPGAPALEGRTVWVSSRYAW